MSDLLTLHRYYIWANRMRDHFDRALGEFMQLGKRITDSERATKFFAGDPGIFMSYWYGGLYVVVEGWRELGLHDPDIDRLIDSPNTELLRRYRNGAFHFQRNYFDERFHGFIEEEGSAFWVRELNRSLGRFFLQKFSPG